MSKCLMPERHNIIDIWMPQAAYDPASETIVEAQAQYRSCGCVTIGDRA